jgi:hypothetical protein
MAYKTIFLTIAQVIWGWGKLGIYVNVANGKVQKHLEG